MSATRIYLECDLCQKHYTEKYDHRKHNNDHSDHYCSQSCHLKYKAQQHTVCAMKGCEGIVSNASQNKIYCPVCIKIKSRRKRDQARRQELFELLGNKCIGCGETDPIFFQVDHINNDASTDVVKCSVRLRDYLAEPHRFQLLCANCNHAKRMNNGVLYRKCG